MKLRMKFFISKDFRMCRSIFMGALTGLVEALLRLCTLGMVSSNIEAHVLAWFLLRDHRKNKAKEAPWRPKQ